MLGTVKVASHSIKLSSISLSTPCAKRDADSNAMANQVNAANRPFAHQTPYNLTAYFAAENLVDEIRNVCYRDY